MLKLSQIALIRQMYQRGMRKIQISRELNISRPTIDKALNMEFNSPTIEEYVKKYHARRRKKSVESS